MEQEELYASHHVELPAAWSGGTPARGSGPRARGSSPLPGRRAPSLWPQIPRSHSALIDKPADLFQ